MGTLIVTGIFSMITYFAPATEVAELKAEHESFAASSTVEKISLRLSYSFYYDTLDRLLNAEEKGNDELVREYSRQLEKIRAEICAIDSQWERCQRVIS